MKTLITVGLDVVAVDIRITPRMEHVGPPILFPGWPDAAARETSIRLRSALALDGERFYSISTTRLEASDVYVQGVCDVAIAAAMQGETKIDDSTLYLGELTLTGQIQPMRGVVPLLLAAKSHGFKRVVLPEGNACDATFAPAGLQIFTRRFITDEIRPLTPPKIHTSPVEPLSLDDIKGNEAAKETLRKAAKERRGVLLLHRPGAPAVMLGRRCPALLGALAADERTTVASIFSVAGLLNATVTRPFRAPHHTVSEAGLIGDVRRPGEVSLAHHGVLFLDQAAEFRKNALGWLRSVVGEGRSRSFPARPWIVAASSPCPCGQQANLCHCPPEKIQAWMLRLRDMTAGLCSEEVEVTL